MIRPLSVVVLSGTGTLSARIHVSVIRDKIIFSTLTFCIQKPLKQVLLQTVNTQMKCSMVYAVCKGKKNLQTKENNVFLE